MIFILDLNCEHLILFNAFHPILAMCSLFVFDLEIIL